MLFAALQAGTYAPELTVRAAAVAAPAADLGTLLDDDIGDVSGVTIGSYAFAAYQQAYAAQNPGLELTGILTDAGAAVTPMMAGLCLFGDNDKLHALATPLLVAYLRSDHGPRHRGRPSWPRTPQEHRPRGCRCSWPRVAPTPWSSPARHRGTWLRPARPAPE